MRIGDLLLKQGNKLSLNEGVRHFHTKVFIPEWYLEYFDSFNSQITKMSSPTKPFKATDYFKIKAGYPHEVMMENKNKLGQTGCKRDKLTQKKNITIPKLTYKDYVRIKSNLIGFTAPLEKDFIRDITIYDDETDNGLVYIYVVSRKAQIITAWSEPKIKGEYIIKKPKNILKSLQYELE